MSLRWPARVRNPGRALPLALVGGVACVGALYMLTNAAVQYILPATAIATTDRPAADALRLVRGNVGAGLVSAGMAVSICATFIGSSLSGARVPFAAAADGLLPKSLASVNTRFSTPAASLLLQASISSLLILAVGKFQALFSIAIFSEWLFYALTTSTLFVFRYRAPNDLRPFRTPGYPWVPAIFIIAAVALMVFSFVDQPRNSTAGAIVILFGVPVYFAYHHRRNQTAQQ